MPAREHATLDRINICGRQAAHDRLGRDTIGKCIAGKVRTAPARCRRYRFHGTLVFPAPSRREMNVRKRDDCPGLVTDHTEGQLVQPIWHNRCRKSEPAASSLSNALEISRLICAAPAPAATGRIQLHQPLHFGIEPGRRNFELKTPERRQASKASRAGARRRSAPRSYGHGTSRTSQPLNTARATTIAMLSRIGAAALTQNLSANSGCRPAARPG